MFYSEAAAPLLLLLLERLPETNAPGPAAATLHLTAAEAAGPALWLGGSALLAVPSLGAGRARLWLQRHYLTGTITRQKAFLRPPWASRVKYSSVFAAPMKRAGRKR